MNLSDYLKNRGVQAFTLSRNEAEILGIDWPLKSGWPHRHGDMEISAEQLDKLRTALVACRSGQNKVERKARRKQEKLAQNERIKADMSEYIKPHVQPAGLPSSIRAAAREMVPVTRELILLGKSERKGWCAAQLRILGIAWPPESGWIDRTAANGIWITSESAAIFVGYASGDVSKTSLRKHNRKSCVS